MSGIQARFLRRFSFTFGCLLFCAVAGTMGAQLEVAPGLPFPPGGKIWILDQGGDKARLFRIHVNVVQVNGHRPENFLRAELVVIPKRATIDLPGTAATLRIQTHTPVIFVRKSVTEESRTVQPTDQAAGIAGHYALLRLQVAKDHRVLCTFTAYELGLKSGRHETELEVSTEEVANGQWLKITPKQTLPDGEFALVHMPDNEKFYESTAYDFGVGPGTAEPAGH
jgi:hypothetical protein